MIISATENGNSICLSKIILECVETDIKSCLLTLTVCLSISHMFIMHSTSTHLSLRSLLVFAAQHSSFHDE